MSELNKENSSFKILVIDDDESIRKTLTNYLKKLNFNVYSASNGSEGIEIAQKEIPDLVITDIKMPKADGFEVLKKVKEIDSHIHVIMITAFDDMSSTVKAMQQGAYDYIEKPLEIDKLKITISRALENKKMSEQLTSFITVETEEYQSENTLIGKSSVMKDVYKKIGQTTTSRVTVLLEGESGTGKELVARAIHYSGITKDKPFVPVNCTALTESLLESELFGHVKGAFTGSIRDKKGKFELAGEGTIFLDEISEISPNLQVQLLRVLQQKEFERVGGETLIPIKARIIAATNKDLNALVSDGEFREDLYFRLKVVSINLPPLRERLDDVPFLVSHFLAKINNELHKNVTKVPEDVMEMLKNHYWVGNVRELENTLMQAVVLSSDDILNKENILLRKPEPGEIKDEVQFITLAENEKNHIKKVLDAVQWDKNKAYKILGISLPTLYSKIENYKLSPFDDKSPQ
ncbi:MAG: sigma-54-dependent Fis family transcriptional regulator [Ignavibacteriota bacterium]|jgi:DNA-binding NtrC family response regulator|nr:sigma-54-dependent Fis family transcriptional regulator [Ignavibacteriota bacterium]MBV6420900.1 Regulatory protein AtoC [Ignavibacteriaceae bacterium]MCO6446826.1 sigma-54-dependent Fis family transcriptional regulator [Ignavibacterium album]MDT3696755.1 sigma-54 dependent transcriptional regulator [Ignavibacterium sp.]QKJ99268.1 MAG: sigma-54-dependent Fis family transcriptional regulator [Ignavibacteriota bacterium]